MPSQWLICLTRSRPHAGLGRMCGLCRVRSSEFYWHAPSALTARPCAGTGRRPEVLQMCGVH
eukprot:5162427-Alexandrium_andersonii.AAC.1